MSDGVWPRPRVVLSRCLELEACRYNAQSIRSAFVRLLAPHVELVPVCPEVEIGLGVPRPPIRLVRNGAGGRDDALRLIQPSTGRDLTERMAGWAHGFVDDAGAVDGVVLKSRSPSCGIGDVKVFAGADDEAPAAMGAGAFARVVLERYRGVAVEDEVRLTDAAVRHHFLTRIYASARLRAAVREGPAGLVRFQTSYKLVLMAHSPSGQRELGRLVGGGGEVAEADFEARSRAYREGVAGVLARPAGVGANVNVLEHARGYFKRVASSAEKRRLDGLLDAYGEERVPLQAVLAELAEWVDRFDQGYLREQAYFRPYPDALVEAGDGGRERLT